MSDSDVMSSASGMGVAASDLLTQLELQHERQRLLPAQPHAPTVTHASEPQPQPQPRTAEGLSAPTGLSSPRQGIPGAVPVQYSVTTFAGNCTVQGGYYCTGGTELSLSFCAGTAGKSSKPNVDAKPNPAADATASRRLVLQYPVYRRVLAAATDTRR